MKFIAKRGYRCKRCGTAFLPLDPLSRTDYCKKCIPFIGKKAFRCKVCGKAYFRQPSLDTGLCDAHERKASRDTWRLRDYLEGKKKLEGA